MPAYTINDNKVFPIELASEDTLIQGNTTGETNEDIKILADNSKVLKTNTDTSSSMVNVYIENIDYEREISINTKIDQFDTVIDPTGLTAQQAGDLLYSTLNVNNTITNVLVKRRIGKSAGEPDYLLVDRMIYLYSNIKKVIGDGMPILRFTSTSRGYRGFYGYGTMGSPDKDKEFAYFNIEWDGRASATDNRGLIDRLDNVHDINVVYNTNQYTSNVTNSSLFPIFRTCNNVKNCNVRLEIEVNPEAALRTSIGFFYCYGVYNCTLFVTNNGTSNHSNFIKWVGIARCVDVYNCKVEVDFVDDGTSGDGQPWHFLFSDNINVHNCDSIHIAAAKTMAWKMNYWNQIRITNCRAKNAERGYYICRSMRNCQEYNQGISMTNANSVNRNLSSSINVVDGDNYGNYSASW
jgi:hypothetical protein